MKKIILFTICLTFVVGCTENFDEINTNPSSVNRVEAGLLFNPLIQNPIRNYQRNINLYPDLFVQYWANTISGFESPRYEYVDGWIGNQWREFYTETLAEANTLREWYGDEPSHVNALAVLEIWMCSEWARMAQTYGDIPYFGTGLGVTEGVTFNTEKEIYYDLFDRLAAAVDAIDPSDASQYNYSADQDLFFQGDLEKWKRFGNSVRLRLAIRLSNVDPTKGQAEAVAAINAGVMQSNADNVSIPIWATGFNDYLHKMAREWDNIRISKTFTDLLYSEAGFEDPRAPQWLTYEAGSPLADSGVFEGLINGYDLVPESAIDYATLNLESSYPGFSGDGARNLLYMPIMFYSEVLFIQAEAALRGWTGGDANALYKAGIQASMDLVGVDPADATAYIDAIPELTGTNEQQLKQLITQKYIANFPNGIESWVDFRRTDYPDITLPIDGVSSNASVAQGTWVKRIRYPNSVHDNEPDDILPAGRKTIAEDRMDIRLWWDTADTKTKSGGLMNSNF